MRIINRKWWLTALTLLLVLTSATASNAKPKKKQWNVPEGGSALVYVLGAGITCLGAMVVRSRSARPKLL
jgi:hypothetical protein